MRVAAQDTRLTGLEASRGSALSAVVDADHVAGRVVVTTLAESWNGTTWSIVPSPNTGPTVSALQGVSCATATACIAVGYSQTKTRALSSTLIESWNGTT